MNSNCTKNYNIIIKVSKVKDKQRILKGAREKKKEAFPDGSPSEESACNEGDLGSVSGLGRSPGGRHSHLLQDSHLKNPMDGGAWQATVPRVAKSRTRLKQLSTRACPSFVRTGTCYDRLDSFLIHVPRNLSISELLCYNTASVFVQRRGI